MSNREVARLLGVDESAVRRGLKDAESSPDERRFLVTVREL